MVSCVPQLILRDLPQEVVRRLEQAAANHGVSPEEEHRRILQSALSQQNEEARYHVLKDILLEMPAVEDESIFERSRERPREIDLS